jgi:lysyl-tRNA synthetase class 1
MENNIKHKSWAFAEAYKLKERFENGQCRNPYMLFETGYGPSGLPHIGTFGEVARTSMVMCALKTIAPHIPSKLICFSDDMDGLRKIPDNVPNPEMLADYLDKPLTAVPDPFGTHPSYGAHMNGRLCAFLDSFGFEYEFRSATDCYKSGAFDEMLLRACEKYDAIMKVMLPSLGEERQKTYSPFLPISPATGKVLYVPMIAVNADKGEITFEDEGKIVTISVCGGTCKLQWKPDFGMRWAGLGVDFEMYGKDHLVNGKIYSVICRILGGNPPQQFNYELFLDEAGQKISKSKGNGISLEQWLTYAPQESLALYMWQNPTRAKRLYFDVIPKAVDEYLVSLQKYHASQDEVERQDNPTFVIHNGDVPPAVEGDISYSLLLNLAVACNPDDKSVLWGYIKRYLPNVNAENNPFLDKLVGFAVRYYTDFVTAAAEFRAANELEKEALLELRDCLACTLGGVNDAEILQNELYRIGRERFGKERMREWFGAIYEVLLGQKQGPRLGSFIALYGCEGVVRLIDEKLSGA